MKLSSMAYKSKCKNCDICGIIHIVRDVEAEEKETEFRILHPPIPSTPQGDLKLNESKDSFV
jgi:hypothetical protein